MSQGIMDRMRIADSDLSIPQLKQAIQNGTLPAYVGIPMLEEKIAKEQRLQAASQAGQQQQQMPIASQVLAKADQMTGIPALQTNLPTVHRAAEGGIIAFDEGGYVPHYAGATDGSLVSSAPYGLLGRLGLTESEYVRSQRQLADMKARLSNMVPGTAPYEDLKQSIYDLNAENRQKYTNQPSIFKKFSTDTNVPVSAAYTAPSQDYSKVGAISPDALVSPKVTTTSASPTQEDKPVQPIPAGPGLPALPIISTKLGRATNLYTPEVLQQLEESRKPVYLDEKTYVPPELSVDDAAKRVKDVQAAFGVSEKPYEEQSARLKKRGEDLEAKRSQNKWDALIAAGLAVAAGKSPNVLQNIAEGGIKGLQAYTDAQDKLEASREKLDIAQFALADAQNRFRQEGSKEAAAELRENRTEVRNAKRDIAKDKVAADRAANIFKREDVRNAITEAGRVQTANLTQESREADLQFKRAEITLQRAGLDIQGFNAQTQRIVAQRPDLVSTVLSQLQSDPTYQAADGQTKADMFAKAISGTKAQGTSGLTAQVIRSMDRARDRIAMNPRYLKAQKDGDKKTMQEIEQEEFRKIPGYDAISGLSTAGGASSRAVSFNDLPE